MFFYFSMFDRFCPKLFGSSYMVTSDFLLTEKAQWVEPLLCQVLYTYATLSRRVTTYLHNRILARYQACHVIYQHKISSMNLRLTDRLISCQILSWIKFCDLLARNGDFSWTVTPQGHFFSKWANFSGHFKRVNTFGEFS